MHPSGKTARQGAEEKTGEKGRNAARSAVRSRASLIATNLGA